MSENSIFPDDEALKAALAACSEEPIHLISKIQSPGYLMALDPSASRIEVLSANAQALFGTDPAKLLGTDWRALFDQDLRHQLRNRLGYPNLADRPAHVGVGTFQGQEADLTIHLSHQRPVIEFRPIVNVQELAPIHELQTVLNRLSATRTVDQLLNEVVKGVRRLIRFDRVMAYRFAPDGSGEVVAESVAGGVSPFLGLRYPAHEIPEIARTLFRRFPIRVNHNLTEDGIPLVSLSDEPLDLSLAMLRATASVHRQYMANMEIQASMSISLVVEGELWGLIACHNECPAVPTPAMLSACQILSPVIGMRIQEEQQRMSVHAANAVHEAARMIATYNEAPFPNLQQWDAVRNSLKSAVPADQVVFDVEGQLTGLAPDSAVDHSAAFALFRQRTETEPTGIWCADQIQSLTSDAALLAQWAGVLSIQLRQAPATYMYFLRHPTEQTLRWAGAPEKPLTQTGEGWRLQPRASFAEYLETVRDRSEPWTAENISVARRLAGEIKKALQVADDGRVQRQHLKLLVHELNHRVRNILTLVRSLIAKTQAPGTTLEDYQVALEQRIFSLATAHNMLSRAADGNVDLYELVEVELAPYSKDHPHRARIQGPQVRLSPSAGPMMALVLHELSTNAAKHGAYANDRGWVEVTWGTSPEGLYLEWAEHDGPEVKPPSRRGFGRSLLERALPHELDGEAELRFAPKGLQARFTLPHEVMLMPLDPSPAAPQQLDDESSASPLCILVVEDNYIIAEEVEAILKQTRADVHIVGSVRRGLKILGQQSFDIAILDVNLRGELSVPIADQLIEHKVPFIFMSGYGDHSTLPVRYKDYPLITKPVSTETLLTTLNRALKQ